MLSFLNDLSVISAFRKTLGCGLGGTLCALLMVPAAFAASTTTTLSVTSVGSAVTTIPSGNVVTLTATVSSGAGAVTTGQVNFCDATVTYCTDIHLMGTAQLTSAGTAVLRFVPGIGSHSYKAVFVGTNSNVGSSSSTSALTITGLFPTAATIASSGTAGNYTLTATVAGVGAMQSGSPTGAVSLLDTSNGNSVLGTLALGAGTARLDFTNPSNPTAPAGSTVVADFNGDGRLDVASASLSGAQISVLLGDGTGSFTATNTITTPAPPYILLTADFNGDGRADLAVLTLDNSGTTTLTVFDGNGDGTFVAAGSPVALSGTASAIVTGDFDGDGIVDMAVANQSSGTISVLLGNGDGTFHAAPTTTVTQPFSLAVGDFNGDGRMDLAVMSAISNSGSPSFLVTDAVTVLLGNGDGTFTAAAQGSPFCCNAYAIATGDFNGDGKMDIAFPIYDYRGFIAEGSSLDVLMGNGDGTFTEGAGSPLNNGANLIDISVGDFNGDGKADLVISGTPVSIFLGKGDGSFTLAVTPSIGDASGGYLAVGDFNGDGATDFVAPYGNLTVELAEPMQAVTGTLNNYSLIGSVTHQIAASYPGDSNYSASISSTVGLTALPGTTLTMSASPTTSTYGQQVVLTATLTPYNTPGHSTDGETVSFFYDAAGDNLGTATLASGVATLNTTYIPAGTNSLRAVYGGDGVLAPSSGTLSYTVTTLPSISFSVANHTYGDAPFSVTATSNSTGAISYSVVSGPATISGSTVTLTGAGTAVLQASQAAAGTYSANTKTTSIIVNKATLAIAANNAARVFGAANPTFTGTATGGPNGDTFVETFSTAATAASMVGTYPIVPSVTGADLGNYTITATNGALTISQAGTATTFALSNQNLTLTATVAPLVSGVPTGSVSFYEGQTLAGTGILSNGIASYTASSFPAGNVVVSAQYSGDANFTQSTSPPILVLSVTPGSTSLTVAQSGSVMDTLNLSPIPGYTGTVQLSCSNLPQSATCSFQPSTLVFTGTNSSASASVTIQTGVSAQAAIGPFPGREKDRPALLAAMLWIPGLLLRLGRNRRKISSRIFLLLLLCSMAAGLTACGGSSTPGSGSTGKTPTGAYTVGIVASGPSGLSQTTNLNLTVQ
jgi:hypothetical protein